MAMNQEIKERIFTAADELYADSDGGEYPSIEAVRQRCRAGMNNVVEAMKEWRARQRKQGQIVREPLPAELHGALQLAGQQLWEVAQKLANDSLDAMRAAFETEKLDLAELSEQQSAAFEAQAGELEAAQARMAELQGEMTAAAEQQAQELAELRAELGRCQRHAASTEQKAQETERRAIDLRAELDRAHRRGDSLHQERDQAREMAARLQGELDATKAQNAALLAVFKPV